MLLSSCDVLVAAGLWDVGLGGRVRHCRRRAGAGVVAVVIAIAIVGISRG